MNKLITLIIKKFVWLFFAVRFVHIEWGSGRVMLPCWHSLISKINIKKFSSKKQNKIDKAATINLHRYTYYVRCHGSNVKCRDHHEKCSRLNVCVLWIKANLLANLKSKPKIATSSIFIQIKYRWNSIFYPVSVYYFCLFLEKNCRKRRTTSIKWKEMDKEHLSIQMTKFEEKKSILETKKI